MSKISRADSKARFRTGMYPTQADFENLHDSYVHKDDTIPLEQVGTDGVTVVSLLNKKANSSHSHEIADVNGLEKFVTEMTSLLEIVRDSETGEISQSKLKTLTEGIAALRDDIDTNTDNVAGHETRIQTNEAALEKVYQILGKDAKESIADLANRFAALSGNYANVYAFVNKVKQFLEDADASDETINRWQEIEAFLQGVTDTQTLTGLLEQQRTDLEGRIAEAIAAIPKGNYLKLVPDLDAYTDAPDGEIVKYTGETNDKYTHGWDYERKAGVVTTTTQEVVDNTPTVLNNYFEVNHDGETYVFPMIGYQPGVFWRNRDSNVCVIAVSQDFIETPNESYKSDGVYFMNRGFDVSTGQIVEPVVVDYLVTCGGVNIREGAYGSAHAGYRVSDGKQYVGFLYDSTNFNLPGQVFVIFPSKASGKVDIYSNDAIFCYKSPRYLLATEEITLPSTTHIETVTTTSPSTWQLCPASPVIS